MSPSKPVTVLHFVNDLSNGGIQVFCLNVNRNIDKRYKFDYFLPVGDSEFYKQEVEKLGAAVFNMKSEKIPKFIPKSLRIFYSVMRILRKKQYSAVHIHQCKGVSSILLAAFLCKVPARIIHSHNSLLPSTGSLILKLKISINAKLRQLFTRFFTTHKLGCSESACISLYGSDCLSDQRTKVIFNGIELEKFDKTRYNFEELKKTYKLQNQKINLINIGRFEDQKNHLFLIEIFKELIQIRDDVSLTLVGHGSLESSIKESIQQYNLTEMVHFLPHNSCIPEVLSMMDYFILPSLHEGLGIVLIEAQTMGLPCFASNVVPSESQLGLCTYIPLEAGAKEWAAQIDRYIQNQTVQIVDEEQLNRYDIKNVVKVLAEIYTDTSFQRGHS